MLVMGEVHTVLLQNSGELPESDCEKILALLAGERVRLSRRPVAHAVSPETLTGVDCRLPSASRARVRGVGTVVTRCAVTGGRVAQASAYARVTRAGVDRRLPWSHYLAVPGTIEVLGKAREDDLAAGCVAELPAEVLDLGAICGLRLDAVQSAPLLDRRAPFRASRTRLRWVAGTGDPSIHLTVHDERLRTLRLSHPEGFTAGVVDLCEDLALHDWLLTALLLTVGRARRDGAAGLHVPKLDVAIDHLLHLWMPAARLPDALLPLWEALDRRAGLTRQWRSLVDRVRDQVAMNTLALLRTTADAGGEEND
ncbi:SCO2521 family protein [Sphaerisporangium aureirubrum]|uniref:SCO2521 family protein n=1 Tax=Sphaerisporangium aureirubrum TaxID=1544736 RepID=A0ABW1NUB7_9ACTN